MDFMIGGVAGAVATVVSNPMDVVKTRMQLQGELRAPGWHTARYRGVAHAVNVIARHDGILALQKGLHPAVLVGFTINSVRLGIYHIAEAQGWTRNKQSELCLHKTIFWSSAGGVVSGFAVNPIAMLKTRMQAAAHPYIAVGRQHFYKGLWDGCASIYRTEGIKGFFAGVSSACIRLAVITSTQLGTFTASLEYLKTHGYLEQSPLTRAFVSSLGSGALCVLLATPLDVVNIRLFNQGSPSCRYRLYNGVLDCFAKVYRTEGIHGFYKGVGPLYLRIAPHTTVILVVWDMLNDLLEKYRNKRFRFCFVVSLTSLYR